MKVKVIKRKMTHEIIEKIIEIDKKFYLDFDYDNEKSWYFQRYSDKNDIFLLIVEDKIVGYFLFYSITKKLFDEILSLKYDGDYAFSESEVNVKSNFFYIPSVLVLKEYRKYCVPLLKELLKESSKKKNLVAITVSNEGKRMAESVLSYIGTANKEKNICVYTKRSL